MIRTELIFDTGYEFLTRFIDVPFALVPGMELVLDDHAWWRSFRIDSSSWEAIKSEVRCWVEFLGDEEPDSAIDAMIRDGWVRSFE